MAAVTCAANLTVTAARPASAGRGQNISGSLAVTAARSGFVANKIIGASLAVTAVTDGGENVFPLEFPYVTDGTPAIMHRDAVGAANLTVGVTPYVGDVDGDSALFHQCEQIWSATQRLRRKEESLRREQPLIRIWDAEWELQHLMSNDYKSTFSWISNDSGPGQSEIPFDSPLAAWIHDMQGRIDRGENRNVHVTVDYCGARWSGRLDKYSIEQREDGDEVMVVDWLHDYENTKWIACWSNPFL